MRICHEVIDEMIAEIPEDEAKFKEALDWNKNDSMMKAPEETLQWFRTARTLEEYISIPEQDWQWKVLSIWTTKSIDDLKYGNI